MNESKLSIDETRVKHAFTRCCRSACAHDSVRADPDWEDQKAWVRTSVFSFVARRVGDGWLCASAHNTDVVPHMETNIVDDEGAFRAANYQNGHVS